MGKRYTVEETSIKATADAIREKLGNTNSIEWKNGSGFANAVGAIVASGSGGSSGGVSISTKSSFKFVSPMTDTISLTVPSVSASSTFTVVES